MGTGDAGGRRAPLDAATLDWLESLLAAHRRAEDLIGSRPLVAVVRQQLRTVLDLYAGARGPLADRVVRLAAEHAQFLAWLAQDQNQAAAALAWYDRAHEWALEAGEANMATTALSMKAHVAWSHGNAPRCVRLARAAGRTAGGASPGTRGMAVQMAARGHALAGEAEQAARAFDEAQELVARAARRPEDEPPWLYFYDENWFALQRGMAAVHLGDWRTATDLLGTGLGRLPADYRQDRACLAHALAASGEHDHAVAVALAAAPDAAAVGRPHACDRLHTVAALLLRRRARPGRDLVAALRELD